MSESSADGPATGEQITVEETAATTPGASEETVPWNFSASAKAAFVFAGVIMPVICFLLAGSPALRPSWQSGRLQDFAMLLLSPKSSFPVFPLLLYSIGSMIVMICEPARFSRYFVVRFGVYTGVPLAIQYFVIVSCTGALSDCDPVKTAVGIVLASLISWGVAWLILLGSRKTRFPGCFLVVVLMTLFVGGVIFSPFAVLIVVASATPWAAIAYGIMSFQIINHRPNGRWQFSLAQLLGFISWWAMYLAAWRVSIKMMWIEYAKLPVSPPECYVATAAARGHRRWVGAKPVRGATGKTLWVNDQLRHLKAAELALAATCPKMHRQIRAVYDRLGPPAAELLVHPLLADAAYAALKPAEWTARVAMRLLLPGSKALIARLYREDCVLARREP
ncbi:MAG: hypothetical protein GX621_02755 [Pirellulaceae bacterium]|nr:hypothetical protein [Pirellulaceae bacterium]